MSTVRPIHEVEQVSDADLERLSQDPSNRVYRSEVEVERPAWDMDVAIPMFQGIHKVFEAHCRARPADAEADAAVRQQIRDKATGDWRRLIDDHPTLFEKLTDRAVVEDPAQLRVVWTMLALHRAVGKGELTMDEARAAFVQQTLPQFAAALR